MTPEPPAGTLARSNDLTITVRPVGGGEAAVTVTLPPKPDEAEPPSIDVSRPQSGLRSLNDRLRSDLEDACESYKSDLGGSDVRAAKALEAFYSTGREYWAELLGDQDDLAIIELENRLKDRRGLLHVELKTPDDLTIPVEILPLRNWPIGNGVADWASSLTAFRAVVRTTFIAASAAPEVVASHNLERKDAGLIGENRTLYGVPEVPVMFLWDADAPASALSRKTLDLHRARGRIILEGPYPTETAHYDRDGLAALLVNPPVLEAGADIGPLPSQIVHVNAHAWVGQRKSIRAFSSFEFSYYVSKRRLFPFPSVRQKRVPVRVSNSDLRRAGSRSVLAKLYPDRGPVAFFSACGAVGSAAHGQGAFVNSFLRYGYRAVIGPPTDVPGIVAHAMWKAFLEAVLVKRMPIGRALHEARVTLLASSSMRNPLGALMMLYGTPDLALASKQSKEVS